MTNCPQEKHQCRPGLWHSRGVNEQGESWDYWSQDSDHEAAEHVFGRTVVQTVQRDETKEGNQE